MNNYFKLKENGTSVRTEVVAGFTTFFTMAYIIFVNPAILSKAGMDFNSVLLATCLSAGVGTLLIGLLSNYPFAQAPGMGLNAFFTFTVVLNMGYTWQQALAAVFISGVVFIILTITGLRKTIVESVPALIRHSIPAGIGLFIAFIGLNNAGIVKVNQGPIVDILLQNEPLVREQLIEQVTKAPPQVLEFGSFTNPDVLLAITGLAITAVLMLLQVRAALFAGIVLTVLLGIPMGVTSFPEQWFNYDLSLAPTFLQLDFAGLFATTGDENSVLQLVFTVVTIVISFTLVDLFDTMGTLVGTASKGGFLDKNGRLPRMNRALMADALATTTGALLGTSSVTTYIESGSGIVAGGRTVLTAVVVAVLFFLSVFLAPFAAVIPAAATSPALIIVGILMLGSLKNIDLNNFEDALPAFMIVAIMPFSYSIANGIAAGLIFFTLARLVTGRYREIHPAVFIITLLFIVRFVLV